MTELPAGTVTLVFTDIEGSTRLLRELGDGYADALARHRHVVREALAEGTRAAGLRLSLEEAAAEALAQRDAT